MLNRREERIKNVYSVLLQTCDNLIIITHVDITMHTYNLKHLYSDYNQPFNCTIIIYFEIIIVLIYTLID
jgi:hypothetical protein